MIDEYMITNREAICKTYGASHIGWGISEDGQSIAIALYDEYMQPIEIKEQNND